MKKLGIMFVALMAAGSLQFSKTDAEQTSPVKNQPLIEKIEKQQKRLIEKEKLDELIEQGYSKKEIFMGAIISRKGNIPVDDVLASYKETKSWDKTAKKFGVNIDDLKKLDSIHKWKKLLEHNSSTVISQLAEYTNKNETDINHYIKEGISLRFLVGAAAMAKISNKDLEEIIDYKQRGKNQHEIMKNLNITQDDLHKELEKLRVNIQDKINKQNN